MVDSKASIGAGSDPKSTAWNEQLPRSILDLTHPRRLARIIFRPSETRTVNILNGNRFMICSRVGDISEDSHGVFADDTRFLSLYKATINGEIPSILTSNNTTHYSASFYLTNPKLVMVTGRRKVGNRRGGEKQDQISRKKKEEDYDASEEEVVEGTSIVDSFGAFIPRESLTIHRMRFIEEDIREEYVVTNVCDKNIRFNLSFEVDADFNDIFEVKDRIFAERPDMLLKRSRTLGRIALGRLIPFVGRYIRNEKKRISRSFLKEDNAFDFSYVDSSTGFSARTLVWFSKNGQVDTSNGRISFDVVLAPKQRYRLTIVIVILAKGAKKRRKYTNQDFERQEQKIAKALNAWNLTVPKLDTNWDDLRHSYYQSLVDLTALKMNDPTRKHDWVLPAAGNPWFMTIFGRDTLITSYQSLLFGSNLSLGAISALAEYQSTTVDDATDAQPGKILHEIRTGNYAARSHRFPYYGGIDSTPLFLILISEIYRWTRNEEFVGKYKKNIMSALNWIDKYGDIDKDGFVEYVRKAPDGLDNQCWKDSWNSIQFANGEIAQAPIATCEVQGYVYDAKMRIAEIAREVWKDDSLAKKLLDEANDLKVLFNEKFWIEDRGYYALALEKDKRQVDALTSNNGQLFWSGIVDDAKVDQVVEKLIDGETLFSGYGIRTLSAKNAGFSPIGYHTGCVWAHDNSLIAHGFARYGKYKEADMIIDALMDASAHFGYTLPEAFGGFARLQTGFPVRYPTACSPQAWAAGSPLLSLRTLLGIAPSHREERLVLNPRLLNKGTDIELRGIEAFGKKFVVSLVDGSKPKIYEMNEEDNENDNDNEDDRS